MTHLCRPPPISTMSGLMIEDTWGLPHDCPGAEVRPGGRRQENSLAGPGWAEQRLSLRSRAALQLPLSSEVIWSWMD